jgi:hypothetical protein
VRSSQSGTVFGYCYNVQQEEARPAAAARAHAPPDDGYARGRGDGRKEIKRRARAPPLPSSSSSSSPPSPRQANTCTALSNFIQLAWTFKFVYGAFQDACPIGGKHRTPYILAGWAGAVACGVALASLDLRQNGLPMLTYSIIAAALEFFMMFADVACDALVVGLSALEPDATRGTLLSNAYTTRFTSGARGAAVAPRSRRRGPSRRAGVGRRAGI